MKTAYEIDGLRLAQARHALPGKVSQAEMARRCGLHAVTMNRLENGKQVNVSRETLEVLSLKLGRSSDWLCGKDPTSDETQASARREAIEVVARELVDALMGALEEVKSAAPRAGRKAGV
jgi:transcriptional regulator with XRE-family HTH domain